MPLPPLLAQLYGPQPNVESVLGFVLPTIVFLLLCGVVPRWGRTQASKLLALGLLVAVLSVGYREGVGAEAHNGVKRSVPV